MKRTLLILLALSLGLNAGLLYVHLSKRAGDDRNGLQLGTPAGSGDPHRRDRDEGRRDPDEFIQRRLRRLTEKLNLDEAQQKEMGGVLGEMLPRILAQAETLEKVRAGLAAEFAKPDMEPERVRALVQDLNRAQGELDTLAAESMLRETSLLKPDQKMRFAEIVPWRFHRRPGPKPR